MLALLDLDSKMNTIYPTFVKKVGLSIRASNIRAQKIIYRMVIAAMIVTDKANSVRFFKEILLVANISLRIIFKILFLI